MSSQNGWTAGVVHHGPPARIRQPEPLHTVVVTRIETTRHDGFYVSADEAFRERVARLRENGIKHTVHDRTIRFEDQGAVVVLAYEEIGDVA